MTPQDLTNTYFVLRHGESQANVRDLIVSDPAHGLEGYGLTDRGKAQAREAFSRADDRFAAELSTSTLIFSSDFLRTKQTAEIASDMLSAEAPVTFTPNLRERFFGKFELGHSRHYGDVWADDAQQKTVPPTESAEGVLRRGLAVIAQVEETHRNRTVLLVSHGDILQILMTWFKGVSPFRHREIDHLNTAELRRL